MAREFEVVSNPLFRNLHVFLVHMASRTPHIHRELEIGYVLKGSMSLRIGNDIHHLEPTDGYLINPLEAHEFHSEDTDAVIMAIQISPRIMESFFSEVPLMRYAGKNPLRSAISDEKDYEELFSLCRSLAAGYLERYDGYEYDCFALTAFILSKLNRAMPARDLTHDDWRPIRQRMERMMNITDYIDDNFYRKLLLEEIAQREDLSMPYLSHMFKDVLGMSFQDYLKKKRFEHARLLILSTNRSLLEISLESGFSDPRYLIKMFESEFGCTPREYRRQRKGITTHANGMDDNAQNLLPPEEALALLKAMGRGYGKDAPLSDRALFISGNSPTI